MAFHYFLISFAVVVTVFSLAEARNGGFSVDLIHRDSPRSPLYDPSATSSQRMADAVRRSFGRVNHFKRASSSPNEAQSEVIGNRGEYLMEYSVGTPPFKVLGIADTGSDLIWMQCEPCTACYGQTDPFFDPGKSKTYRNVPCSSKQCRSLYGTSCSSEDGSSCEYEISYGDSSYSSGDVAFDTLTLGSSSTTPVSLKNAVIGCGHDNDGTFDAKGSGVVGLGRGAVSLVSQLGSSIGGKFSYCLIPLSSQTGNSSKLSFGTDAVVSGLGAVSTPLVQETSDNFYSLTLEGLSVGNERLDFIGASSTKVSKGNIIIDSGTTLTLLPQEFYNKLESAVKKAIDLEPHPDPYQQLSLCYKSESDDIGAPDITAHFTGADVKLNPVNIFVRVNEEVLCLAFIASRQTGLPISIYGNLAQMNFLVGYDTEKKTVSFKPADCTQL